MKIKQYKNAKKNKTYKKLLFFAVFPVVITSLFYYALYQTYSYIERRDAEIFNTGYETGRYDELNQPIDDYKPMGCVNEYGELYHCQKPEITPTITPTLPSNNQGNKDIILNKLAQIESGNGQKRKILDTNGRYSLGLYHFQAHTVKDLYKRYYGKKITIQEAVEIAQDDKLSTQLAHDAIFVKGEKFHWLLSMCKMGELTKGCLTQKQINNLFAKK